MKTIHSILMLTLLLVITSCSSVKDISKTQLMNIRKGMTQDEVVALMKRGPDYRRFENNVEEWEFRGYNGDLFDNRRLGVVVWFVNERVDGMDSFNLPNLETTPALVTPAVEYPLPNNQVHSTRPVVQRPHRRVAMQYEVFSHFVNDLRRGFSSERMKKIDDASRDYGFTSAQCKELVSLFGFTDEKIQFLKDIYPAVVDKSQFADAVSVLTFSSDRDKVWDAIRKDTKQN